LAPRVGVSGSEWRGVAYISGKASYFIQNNRV